MPKNPTNIKPAEALAANKKKQTARGRGHARSKGASSRENLATPQKLSRLFSDLRLRRDGPPGPRIAIGEALRERGLDEYTIADTYVHVVAKLTAGGSDSGGVQKLLVDVLKECSRQIEASRPPMRSANPDAPVIVQLVHTVTRPVRAALEAGNQRVENES